jgi:hypothetical protein
MKRKYLTEDGEIFDHKTKDGRYIPLNKLEDSHLINILKFYKKKADVGVEVTTRYFGLFGDNDMDAYDVDILYGEAALKALNYYAYEEEAKLRWGKK